MITAARGSELRCRNWRTEALLRMLENVLEVAERADALIVYASLGKAARDWGAYEQIVAALEELDDDQTLVLQSGRPVGVLMTHSDAPMVVSAVNNTVGRWATEELFYKRMREGSTIWGGLTAAAWQYIGRQGVLQGTYEVLRAALWQHFSQATGSGRWLLTAGLGGMGSAQPISAKMLELSSLTVEIDRTKLDKLTDAGGLDLVTSNLGEALLAIEKATSTGSPSAIGLHANAAAAFPLIVASGCVPDLVTDQTAAHDARYGYLPEDVELDQWQVVRERNPAGLEQRARQSMAKQVTAILDLVTLGSVAFENGNNLRVQAATELSPDRVEDMYQRMPGFMEAYLRPLFCRGIGPFRWVLLSGSSEDRRVVDDLATSLFPERPEVAEWISLARKWIPPQGLPARSCWLGHGERSKMAIAVNDAVRDGRITAPVAFTRDHLDSAGMTHPRIGSEGMRDGSDGVTDWPILDAMVTSAAGADLVAVHSGGGGYTGWMQSAGLTVVADGTAEAEQRLRRALDVDSGLGVLRHATAGYPEAINAVVQSSSTTSPLQHIQN
jgi:urocanate hydratase